MKSFIQLPKHKVFEYKPLYYDPDKEYIKRRREELGLESEVEKLAGTGGMLRAGSMRMRHAAMKPRMEDGSRQRFVRRWLIALILCAILYAYLGGKLDSLISLFMQAN
ncbi:MAG: hypothetical protein MR215_05100 [Bacteroidales bacterium]|nr:hypothetical protein [Bacteroidales bacterium]MDD7725703.1 hypothetical protein [Bacteroidales bacterium]MDY4175472.1 hypothetical protein [Bacteroidales bacterium]